VAPSQVNDLAPHTARRHQRSTHGNSHIRRVNLSVNTLTIFPLVSRSAGRAVGDLDSLG
jgi:hypothetical protein